MPTYQPPYICIGGKYIMKILCNRQSVTKAIPSLKCEVKDMNRKFIGDIDDYR